MPLTGRWTLTRYLIEERRRYPQASGELNALILDVDPSDLTPALINRYLDIKARHLL